ncbi:MAG: 5'/3'-nucleotidase SurE [Kofleriaceae bacterium]
MRPLVLCSNDDGIQSPLLLPWVELLESMADVLVVAPERQRSAASHAITLHKPLRLVELSPGRFSLSGTPVDCVYVGMLRLAPRPPTLVISGINDGYNLGTDVFYSGTVAAAVEGALRGSVGIALSLAPRAQDLSSALTVCKDLVAQALTARAAGTLAAGSVLNVNLTGSGATAVRWTRLGRRSYEDDVKERSDPRGRPYYWIGGGGATGHDPDPDSDCGAVEAGVNSVTPLHLDITDHRRVETPLW